MNNHVPVNAEDQLWLITQMMSESKKTILHMGFPSMIWGFCVSIGTLLTYFMSDRAWYKTILPLWIVLFITAFGINMFYFKQKDEKKRKSTLIDRLFTNLWIFIAITVFLFWVVSFTLKNSFPISYILCVVGILVSMGYWLSGILAGLKTIQALSICWLIGSVMVLLVPPSWAPVVIGVWAFLFEAVPGLILYVREQKQPL